jgi:hypothetical protein
MLSWWTLCHNWSNGLNADGKMYALVEDVVLDNLEMEVEVVKL